MNDEHLETYIEPELEARIVAYVLGEASAFEREELERLIEEKPEVKLFHDRIAKLHGMLLEGADKKDDADWTLAKDKRDKLLETFAGKADPKGEQVKKERKVSNWKTVRIRVLAAAAIVTTLAVPVVITFFSLSTSQDSASGSNGAPLVAWSGKKSEMARRYHRFDSEAEESDFDQPEPVTRYDNLDALVVPRSGSDLFTHDFLGGAKNLRGFDFQDMEDDSRNGDGVIDGRGIDVAAKNAKDDENTGFGVTGQALAQTDGKGYAGKDFGRNTGGQWFESGAETTATNNGTQWFGLTDDSADLKEYWGKSVKELGDTISGPARDKVALGVMRRNGSVAQKGGNGQGQVVIEGNNRTRDHVVRRELPLDELGAGEVNRETPDTSYISDKDLLASVTDNPTGTLNFGAGFSSIDSVKGFVEITDSDLETDGFLNKPDEGITHSLFDTRKEDQDFRLSPRGGELRKKRSLSASGKQSGPGMDLDHKTITGIAAKDGAEITRQTRKTAAAEHSKRPTVSSSAFSTFAMPEISQPVMDDIFDLVPGVVGGGIAFGVRKNGESSASDLNDPSSASVDGDGLRFRFEGPKDQKSMPETEPGKAGTEMAKVSVSGEAEIGAESRGEAVDSGGTVEIDDEESVKLFAENQTEAQNRNEGRLSEREDREMEGIQPAQHESKRSSEAISSGGGSRGADAERDRRMAMIGHGGIRGDGVAGVKANGDQIINSPTSRTTKKKELSRLKAQIEGAQSEMDRSKQVEDSLAELESLRKEMAVAQTVVEEKEIDITKGEGLLAASEMERKKSAQGANGPVALPKDQELGIIRGKFQSSVSNSYNKRGVVIVNGGKDQGVVHNSQLDIYRKGRFVGKLLVTSVEDTQSVAAIVPGSTQPDFSIESGDTVIKSFKTAKPVSKPQPVPAIKETDASNTPFSTFSLHVSNVSFKLAHASLTKDEWPDQSRIRIEEFVNAFDYDDPLPSNDERVSASIEQAIHPTMQQRNVLRIALRTAAAGRNSGTPLSITFLLDSSGSMERFDRQETLQRAFSRLAAQLNQHDKVTLISFARQPRLVAEAVAGNRCGELVELVSQLPEEGGTNLEAALQLAFEKAKQHHGKNSQNRIILLTDGAANLGDANPERLSEMVQSMRDSGIAFDAAGIGAEGLNDEILEALTRKGDGRYYLLDRPEDADANFAKQIAGALRPAAGNVKVQVEFNPLRVGKYQLHGFEKHRLKKEDFRNDKVDAAELAAAEAGVALYQVETLPEGQGDIGQVSVRFKDMQSGRMIEKRWPIPYQASLPHLFNGSESIRVATAATLMASKLKGEPLGSLSQWDELAEIVGSLSPKTQKRERIGQLNEMIAKAQAISGSTPNPAASKAK